MPNAQSPQPDPADSAARSSQLFSDGTALEDVSFLTVAEVAGVMRVSKMTVYRMVHSGELTAVRVGRSFRVPSKAVREYLSGAYVGTD
jgi:excisionase family DNA binding protein